MARAVRAALVGAGAWGRVLARAAAGSAKIEFVCCVGRNPERLAEFSRNTGLVARDLGTVLAEPDIDAVVLAVPNELHCELAQQAARSGKHIFIEKPIAHTLPEALAIVQLEQTHRVRIVVGHCARLLAGNRLIRNAIDAGTLGHLTQLEANFSTDRALKLTPRDWRWYSAGAPGGPLSQLAIHQFDTLRFLGGDIAAVSAGAARHSPVGAEVEDQWIVTVHFADGKLGAVISSWTSPGAYSIRATGTDALMFYEVDQNDWGDPERLHENATLYLQTRGTGPAARRAIAVPPGNMFREELELFADSIVAGRGCELSADNGLHALAAVYAALRSAAEGRVILLSDVIAETAAGAELTASAGMR